MSNTYVNSVHRNILRIPWINIAYNIQPVHQPRCANPLEGTTSNKQTNLHVFLQFLQNGNKFCDYLFTSMCGEAFPKLDLLFKERICSSRSKLFPSRVDPNSEERQNENGGVASPEVYPFTILTCYNVMLLILYKIQGSPLQTAILYKTESTIC